MPKKTRVRTLMDTQHVKGCEKLLKYSRQYFCHIFWSLWKEISLKNTILVVSETLRLFVNILTLEDKYCLSVKASVWRNLFKCNYLKIKKYFLDFFLHYRNMHKVWDTLKEKMILKVIFCWNYRMQNAGLFKCLKSPLSENLWTVNMLKGPKDCLNLQRSIFFHIFWTLQNEICSNNSVSGIS